MGSGTCWSGPRQGPTPSLRGVGGEGVLRLDQLVVLSERSSIFQAPLTLTSCSCTVCVQDCAPSVVTVHSEPCGAAWVPLLTDLTLYWPNTTIVAASWE